MMIRNISRYRAELVNKEYVAIADEVRVREQYLEKLQNMQLKLEMEIYELEQKMDELEINLLKELENAGSIEQTRN